VAQNLERDLAGWAAPLLDELELSLYDVELAGGILKIVVDRPGGVALDVIARFTRGLSPILDERDPVKGHYTLEVSSPGLERRLRTSAHFRGAVGEHVKLKLRAGVSDDRRLDGVISAATDDDVTVDSDAGAVTVPLADVESARTVFTWPDTSPPKSSRPKQQSGSRAKPSPTSKKATT
jgi:ribosome maturation factor RimP